MPPNRQIPIEEAGLWDILDWDTVVKLAEDAVGDPRDHGGRSALAWAAKTLIDLAAQDGPQDEQFFHRIFTRFVTAGPDHERRQQAANLALLFGADGDRLIEFAAWKWGRFKRRGLSAK